MPNAAPALVPSEILPPQRQRELFDRALEMRSGRERPNRYWRVDLEAIDFTALRPAAYAAPEINAPAAHGVTAIDLREAARQHPEVLEFALHGSAAATSDKFGAMAAALCNSGAFVSVKRDTAVDEPITVVYRAGEGALFPWTLVMLERGAQCTVIERIEGAAGSFVCGLTTVLASDNSNVTHAVVQQVDASARAIGTRVATPGRDASVTWCAADLGGSLALTRLDTDVQHPGADVTINTLFFPRGDQHVDIISTVDHNAGESTSETLVKSAAIGRGQARYLGNIRIAAHAQGTLASLRDDALLLSEKSHIDSIPALEIAANDVKAYHGATVGALDPEQIFYMCSRGIEREAAERMVALGFFEPVIERFPTNALREELRRALEAKVGA